MINTRFNEYLSYFCVVFNKQKIRFAEWFASNPPPPLKTILFVVYRLFINNLHQLVSNDLAENSIFIHGY